MLRSGIVSEPDRLERTIKTLSVCLRNAMVRKSGSLEDAVTRLLMSVGNRIAIPVIDRKISPKSVTVGRGIISLSLRGSSPLKILVGSRRRIIREIGEGSSIAVLCYGPLRTLAAQDCIELMEYYISRGIYAVIFPALDEVLKMASMLPSDSLACILNGLDNIREGLVGFLSTAYIVEFMEGEDYSLVPSAYVAYISRLLADGWRNIDDLQRSIVDVLSRFKHIRTKLRTLSTIAEAILLRYIREDLAYRRHGKILIHGGYSSLLRAAHGELLLRL